MNYHTYFPMRAPLRSPSQHSCYSSPLATPLEMLYAPENYVADEIISLEREFCSHFVCCNLHLSDLHELLEHFEEAHVVVLASDGTTLYPPAFDNNSPSSSPLILPHASPTSPYDPSSPMSLSRSYSRVPIQMSSKHIGFTYPFARTPSPLQRQNHPHPTFNPSRFEDVLSPLAGPVPEESSSSRPRKRSISPFTPLHTTTPLQHPRPVSTVIPGLLSPPRPPASGPTRAAPRMRREDNPSLSSGEDTDVTATTSTTTRSRKRGARREKAFKCPRVGCIKSYLNPNGLKYHIDKGTCVFEKEPASGSETPPSTPITPAMVLALYEQQNGRGEPGW